MIVYDACDVYGVHWARGVTPIDRVSAALFVENHQSDTAGWIQGRVDVDDPAPTSTGVRPSPKGQLSTQNRSSVQENYERTRHVGPKAVMQTLWLMQCKCFKEPISHPTLDSKSKNFIL